MAERRKSFKSKLEQLRKDFCDVHGKPFDHFYCPILFKDEDVELCKAHILPKAFANSSRACTVMRKDVDNFYGMYFEAEFEKIQYPKNKSIDDILLDPVLCKKLEPQILLNKDKIDYFPTSKEINERYPTLELEKNGVSKLFGLKISTEEFLSKEEVEFSFELNINLRPFVMPTLIKAAHLILFNMLGYSYIDTADAHFLGYDLLGKFFEDNNGKERREIISNAIHFYAKYSKMVRPVQSSECVKQNETRLFRI